MQKTRGIGISSENQNFNILSWSRYANRKKTNTYIFKTSLYKSQRWWWRSLRAKHKRGCFFWLLLQQLCERTARHRRRGASTGLGQPKVSFKFHYLLYILCRSTRAKRARYLVYLCTYIFSVCFDKKFLL